MISHNTSETEPNFVGNLFVCVRFNNNELESEIRTDDNFQLSSLFMLTH